MTSYLIKLLDPQGTALDDILSFTRLEWARKENDVGVMYLDLPRYTQYEQYLRKDLRLELQRTIGTKTYLVGQTQWYLRRWQYISQNGLKSVHLTAFDNNYLLSDPEIEYASDSAQASKTAAIDDMIKAIVRENQGSLATDTTRDLSTYLSVQADLTLAPSTSKAFSRRPMLTVLQELATESFQRGTYLAFDTEYVSSAMMEFRTYAGQRGINHGRTSNNPVIINESRSSLVNPVLDYDYSTELTVVTAGGQGQGADRAIKTVTDPVRLAETPFSRREKFIDTQTARTDLNAIEAEARAALYASRPRVVLTGSIQDTSGLTFGLDYDYGDIVVAEQDTLSFDAHVQAVHVIFEGGKETLDNQIRGVI